MSDSRMYIHVYGCGLVSGSRIIDSIDYVTGIGNAHAFLVHSLSSLPDKYKQYNICKLWLAVFLFLLKRVCSIFRIFSLVKC